MKLHEITIEGLKGAEGTWTLSGLDALLGPNATGKSTVLDGALLLATGYHPRAGRGGQAARKSSDVMRLASGSTLRVSGVCEDEEGVRWTVSRTWKQTIRSGVVSFPAPVVEATDGVRKLKKAQAEAKIAELFGEPIKVGKSAFVPTVDLEALLGPGTSDALRRDLLYRYVSAPSWSWAELWTQAERYGVTYGDLEALWKTAKAREILDELDVPAEPWRPELGLSISEWTARQASFANALELAEKRELGALRGALDVAEQETIEPRRVEELHAAEVAARAAVDGTKASWDEQIAAAKADLEAEAAKATRGEELRGQVEALQARIVALEERDPDGEAARAFASAAAARSNLPGFVARVSEAERALGEAKAELVRRGEASRAAELEVEELRRQVRKADERAGEEERRLGELLEPLRVAVRKEEEALERLDDLKDLLEKKGPQCPVCAQPIPADLLRLTRAMLEGQRDAARQALGDAEAPALERVARRRARAERIREELSEAAAEKEAADGAMTGAEAQERQLLEAAAKAREDAEAARRIVAELEKKAQAVETAQGLEAKIAELRGKIDAMQEERARVASFASLDGLRAEVASLEAKKAEAVAEAETRARQAQEELVAGHRRLERRHALAKAQARVAATEAAWTKAKEVAQGLGAKGLQGALLEASLAPFVAAANRLLEGLDLGTLAVRWRDEQGHEVFWIGLWSGKPGRSAWSHVETLSGGERATVGVAILGALAALSSAPWRPILLDGVETLDRGRRAAFLARCAELVEARSVDQVIVTGCPDEEPDEALGFTVHRFE